jgi:hypothetical protein
MNQREDSNRTLLLGLAYAKAKNASFDPFLALKMYQLEIARRLSIELEFASAQDIQEAVAQLKAVKPAILFIAPTWDIGCEEAELLIEALRATGTVKKIIFVDTCDATSTPYLPLLAAVDLFVKPYLFRDTSLYLREYVGGYIFTDFLVKSLGWDISGWGSVSYANKEHLGKLRVGWSYGVSRRYRALANLTSLLPMPWALRSTDVNRRFCPAERGVEEWYEQYRKMASKAVEKLGAHVKISGYERVKYKRYLLELFTSKMALSPFGFGEVCFRDFEIVACGALLVKPDMTHIRIKPDIFRPNETYVPIKWDFSDLAEKVDYYIAHPNEAKRIAYAGRRCLLKYFKQNEFLKDFKDCLDG